MRKKKNKFLHLTKKLLLVFTINVVLLLVAINSYWVQTELAHWASRKLTALTGFEHHIARLRIDWFDRLQVDSLVIADEHQEPMIALQNLRVNYDLLQLLRDRINLDLIKVNGLQFDLHRGKTSDTLNITRYIKRLKALSSPKKKKGRPVYFSVDNISVRNSVFSYNNGHADSAHTSFDYNHFGFEDITLELEALTVMPDSFFVDIIHLNTVEIRSHLPVNELHCHLLINSHTIRLDRLEAAIGSTVLRNRLAFIYSGYEDLSHFVDSVHIEADFDKTLLSSHDLGNFSTYMAGIDDHYKLSGRFRGKVSDFKVRNLDLTLGKGTVLKGSVAFEGLPRVEDTFMNIVLKNAHLVEDDIEQYIPVAGFSEYNRFTHVDANGSFTGFLNDFVAYGRFDTDLGTIVSDINLKIAADGSNNRYSGNLQLKDFELGAYTGNTLLGRTSLQGSLRGSGFTLNTVKLNFSGNIDLLEVNNYPYANITTDGSFELGYFSGKLAIDDPSLKLNTTNEIDLRNQRNKVYINGSLQKADLYAIGLTADSASLRTDLQADFSGFALDSIKGYLHLENLHATHLDRVLNLNHLTVSSQHANLLRTFEVISDKANIKLTGDFNFTTALNDLEFMGHEYLYTLKNNSDSLAHFYATHTPPDTSRQYYIDGSIKLANVDNFLNLFAPGLSLHGHTQVDFRLRRGHNAAFTLELQNDTLTYNDYRSFGNLIHLDASKFIARPGILASFDIQSDKQIIGRQERFDNLLISAIWENDKINFNWYHTLDEQGTANDIYGEIDFFADSTRIHFSESSLHVWGQDWHIKKDNFLVYNGEEIIIRNLHITSDDQMLAIEGNIADDPKATLYVQAANLDMAILSQVVGKRTGGWLNGAFELSNLYHTPVIVSNFYINNFTINDLLIGDVYSSSDWDNTERLFDVQLSVRRDRRSVILVNGTFDPFHAAEALNLRAAFVGAQLNMTEPFTEGLFSDITGTITGNIYITGPLRAPVLIGNGGFDHAGLRIDYLNTFYRVTGKWQFDSASIQLQNLQLTDSKDNKGMLTGRINHRNFRDFEFDLHGSFDDLMVLNTTAKDNDLFYGTAFGSGNVAFTGPLENLTIKINASTRKGTRFYLPMSSGATANLEDYISFVDFDSLNIAHQEQEENKKETGFNLEMELDITEEAYAEIIFNIVSGDIIRGRGHGHLSMNIDTQGEFTLLGNYEFVEGGYNFTMYNIVNKEFSISPKSSITWSGDPYGGIMDIKAKYKLSTSLAPLIDSTLQKMPDARRIYPVEVDLYLKGPMLEPDIAFDINIDEYPKSNVDLDTQIKAFLATIQTDQQELNRQVFSLLILRKFLPPDAFSSTGTVGSSVSEFVSNQLSYWISQVDENLTIDLDLGNLDADALRTFQLRVSYTFLDGRLIVTRDGGFTDPNNQASVESIAGDWTIEYLLSADGKLRIKLFNKTNYNQLNSTTGSDNQALISGGFSLIYTTSFDKLSDLFKKKGKNKDTPDKEPSSKAALRKEEEMH